MKVFYIGEVNVTFEATVLIFEDFCQVNNRSITDLYKLMWLFLVNTNTVPNSSINAKMNQ